MVYPSKKETLHQYRPIHFFFFFSFFFLEISLYTNDDLTTTSLNCCVLTIRSIFSVLMYSYSVIPIILSQFIRPQLSSPVTTQRQLVTHWRKEPFENNVEKEEIAGDQHFLLFSQCFLSYETQLNVLSNIRYVVCMCFQFAEA